MELTHDKVTAFPRVIAQVVKPFEYHTGHAKSVIGEVMEVRAVGVYGPDKYPISVHITIPPGCGIIPPIGDCITVTVERDTRSLEQISPNPPLDSVLDV